MHLSQRFSAVYQDRVLLGLVPNRSRGLGQYQVLSWNSSLAQNNLKILEKKKIGQFHNKLIYFWYIIYKHAGKPFLPLPLLFIQVIFDAGKMQSGSVYNRTEEVEPGTCSSRTNPRFRVTSEALTGATLTIAEQTLACSS